MLYNFADIYTFQNTDWPTIFKLIVPIILGLLFFLTALAWNEAIRATINLYSADREFLKPTSGELSATWIYTGVISVVLIAYIWILRNELKKDVIQLEPHRAPGIDIGAEGVDGPPAILPVSQNVVSGGIA